MPYHRDVEFMKTDQDIRRYGLLNTGPTIIEEKCMWMVVSGPKVRGCYLVRFSYSPTSTD